MSLEQVIRMEPQLHIPSRHFVFNKYVASEAVLKFDPRPANAIQDCSDGILNLKFQPREICTLECEGWPLQSSRLHF